MGYRAQNMTGGCGWVYHRFMNVVLDKMKCQTMKIGDTRETKKKTSGISGLLHTALYTL